MMTESKKTKFTAVLTGIAIFYGTKLNKLSMEIYWNILQEHELEVIQTAIQSHIKDPEYGRFMPRPADIIRNLPAVKNPVMGADAAWEVAMESRLWDDDLTIVIARAVVMAFPFRIWGMGDKVAARMSFKSAYPSALEKYGDEVTVSLGFHVDSRDSAIMEAVRNNLITNDMALTLLPHMAEEVATVEPPSEIALIEDQS